MKKIIKVLEKAVEMGFSREKAIESIDAALDEVLGYDENRTFNSEISEELYNDMLRGFEEEAESKEKPSTNFGKILCKYGK